eukprot:5517922-Prymnesium_polylepis.1
MVMRKCQSCDRETNATVTSAELGGCEQRDRPPAGGAAHVRPAALQFSWRTCTAQHCVWCLVDQQSTRNSKMACPTCRGRIKPNMASLLQVVAAACDLA